MWDTKIITYHHISQSTSTTAHSSDTNPLVTISLYIYIYIYICRDIRPSRMYWARGPVQGHLISPRMDKHVMEVSTNK